MSIRWHCALLALGWLAGVVPADEPEVESAPERTTAALRQWIVVTTESLEPALAPVRARRTEQGWSVRGVVLPDSPRSPKAAAIRDRIAKLVAGHDGTTVVLLLGAHGSVLPSFEGRHGRMRAEPTDHPYGLPDEREVPTIAVGRLPARTLDEARAMVAKTLALEDRPPDSGTDRIHLMIGDPGAKSKLERRFARTVVKNTAEKHLARLHPMWRPICIADTPGSRFALESETFDLAARRLLEENPLLVGYAGHSTAAGLWSPSREVFNVPRETFATVDTAGAPGLLVSCGGGGCRIDGPDGRGYVLAAIRNARGPAAGIGASGRSHAAFGQLVLAEVVGLLSGDDPPHTLGAYWLAAQNGLVHGRMSRLQFWLYDQADGSGGTVPLDEQRREHVEMWTLLGDPGLQLPFVRPTLSVDVEGELKPGGTLAVEVDLPESLKGGTASILVEPRHLRWADIASPTEEGERERPIVAVLRPIEGPHLAIEMPLPVELPEGEVVVRIVAVKDGDRSSGVAVIVPAADSSP